MDKFLCFVENRRAQLRRQLAAVQEELTQLDEAERAYRACRNGNPILSAGREDGSIPRRVIRILESEPQGLTFAQLLDTLKQSGLPNLKRESLGPQLSRMKRCGDLTHDHGLWRRRRPERVLEHQA